LSDRAQVNIARVSSAVVMILAVAWSTQGGRYSSIFEAINAIASNIAPPITTVFLFGVFWRRGTKEASLATLIFGFSLGAVCFLLDLPAFGSQKLITTGLGIPFLMQAWWSFCLCSIVFVAVSLCTPPPAPEKVEGLTWEHPLEVILHARKTGAPDPRTVAAVLTAVMVALYWIFR
jgi:SSS family solute:Na+ symporter